MNIKVQNFLKSIPPLLLEKKITIIIIFLLSFAIFSINIGSEQIWYDEALSLHFSQPELPELIKQIGYNGAEANPPLYHLIIKGARAIFNENITAFRLISAFFSSLLAVSLYLFTLNIFDRKTAIISILLLCLNPVIIGFSQEIRMYTLSALLCFINISAFYLYLNKAKTLWIVLYAISGIAGLYTQYYFIFTIIITFMIFILDSIYKGKFNMKLFLLYIGINTFFLLAFSPWIPSMVNQIKNIAMAKWTEDITGDILFKIFGYFFSSKFTHDVHPFIPYQIFTFFALFFSGFAVYSSIKKGVFIPKTSLLLGSFLIPLLFSIIYSVLFTSIINFRYFVLFAPFFFILIAYGITCFFKGKWPYIITSIYLIFLSPAIFLNYSETFNGSPKNMAYFLNHNIRQNEKILTFDSGTFLTLNYYIENQENLYFYSPKRLPPCYGTQLYPQRYVTDSEIRNILSTSQSHWMVYTPWTKSLIPELLAKENLATDQSLAPKIYEHQWSWPRFKAEHIIVK
ncbi:MAG: glycosyltransferase family 39 protein [Spirochaetales bacterium]|nr:glycosyltransferase family 39 protein [Spirochaetales bacterium]